MINLRTAPDAVHYQPPQTGPNVPAMDGSITPDKGGAAVPQGPVKGRVAPKLRAAIKLRVEEGLTITEACARAGISEAGWHKAMKRHAVQVEYEQTELAFCATIERRRKQYRARAIEVAAELMERGTSEAVRMRAVEFFAGEARQPAVAVQINNGPSGGYIYRRPDLQSEAIEAQAIDAKAENEQREK